MIAVIPPSNLQDCFFRDTTYSPKKYPICVNGFNYGFSSNRFFIPSILLFCILLLVMLANKCARENFPLNYLLLLLFSVALGSIWVRLLYNLYPSTELIINGVPLISFLGMLCATFINSARPTAFKGFGIGFLVAIALQLIMCYSMVLADYRL